MALAIIVSTFWAWILFVSNFQIDTRAWAAVVTLILEGLYVMIVPLLAVATIAIDCVAIARRTASVSNAVTMILAAAVVGLWAWSLSPSGQVNLQWRK
jgi:hypothetical protein